MATGLKKDYTEAKNWFSKAAEQGQAKAQFNLGVLYFNGQGVKQDYFKAAEWHQKAAEQGYADAQYNLAKIYYLGKGVKQDFVNAKKNGSKRQLSKVMLKHNVV